MDGLTFLLLGGTAFVIIFALVIYLIKNRAASHKETHA